MNNKKKSSIFSKLLHIVNSILAAILLLAYLLPYVSPKTIPLFSVLSLCVPVLILINSLFFIYWIFKLKKHFILSGVVLLIGWFISSPFYRISSKKNFLNNDLKVMSYNVRMFNHYKHINTMSIGEKIINFIDEKKPDILAIQEFYEPYQTKIEFPYKYFAASSKTGKFGLAIFSKYKIIKSGSLNFKDSANNTIYVDILKKEDTIRIYNVHLQSLKINPRKQHFGETNSKRLIQRLEYGFVKQTEQAQKIKKHEQDFKGKKIICGDFNNTAYSWAYQQISKDKKDTFLQAGKGFGKSFNYFFPMRIDFILTDKTATVNHFETFTKEYSDHFPIMTRLNWE